MIGEDIVQVMRTSLSVFPWPPFFCVFFVFWLLGLHFAATVSQIWLCCEAQEYKASMRRLWDWKWCDPNHLQILRTRRCTCTHIKLMDHAAVLCCLFTLTAWLLDLWAVWKLTVDEMCGFIVVIGNSGLAIQVIFDVNILWGHVLKPQGLGVEGLEAKFMVLLREDGFFFSITCILVDLTEHQYELYEMNLM